MEGFPGDIHPNEREQDVMMIYSGTIKPVNQTSEMEIVINCKHRVKKAFQPVLRNQH